MRRGQAGETSLANGQSLHGSADSCGSDRRFLPGETWVAAACSGRAPAASGLRTPRRRGAWDRYRLGHRPVRTSHAVGGAGSMYSQATVSSACVAARAVLRWDGTPEKGGSRQRGHAGTFGGHLPRSNLGACRAAGRVPPVVDSPLRAARVRGGGARSDRASVLPGGRVPRRRAPPITGALARLSPASPR